MGNRGTNPSVEVSASRPTAAPLPPLCDVGEGMDDAAESLERCGVACVRLDSEAEALHARCFETAKMGMAHCASVDPSDPLAIPPEADSAHATGMHAAGWGSAYNATREGFVFSDGACFGVPADDPAAAAEFERSMRAMFASALRVARATLAALERRLELPPGWFESELGPIADHSQWHVKRYRPEARSEHAVSVAGTSAATAAAGRVDARVLLPVHTDPSLISVIIHDAPGVSRGARGLEVLSRGGAGEWTEVPAHGHAVAVVFAGSVLDRITGGAYPAARHRVAVADPDAMGLSRVAATFFWRPAPNATLKSPPSPKLPEGVACKPMMFSTWCKRTAKRYEAHKHPKPKHTQLHTSGTGTGTGTGRRARRREKTNPDPPAISRRLDARDERLSLIGGPLPGREKYLGGALGKDGKIYAIPGFARRVLRIDPETGAVEYVGPEFPGEFKWLRSVTCPASGAIYGLPCHNDAVLKIVPGDEPEITLVGLGKCGTGPWKFHGGVLSPDDGCIYCVPQFAERVLKIDPATDECELIGATFPGKWKWYGGLLGTDGRIYGVPQCASSVLRIDPKTGTCETFGSYPEGGWKWHGGTVGMDGAIYGIPAHADTVLKIIPGDEPEIREIGGPLRTGKHRTDGRYKYLGGVLAHDGCVYMIPSDADYVLRVNCATDECREVGDSLENEAVVQNKWQNGFIGEDGVMWGIPLKAETVLTIVPTEPGKDPVVKTVGGPFKGLNLWEGGVVSGGPRPKFYCMPLNHKSVLEIDPWKGRDAVVVERRREGMASTAGMQHD